MDTDMGTGKRICSDCGREFQSPESLSQHRQAKHAAQPQQPPPGQPKEGGRNPKKIVIAAAALVVTILAGYFIVAAISGNDSSNSEKAPAALGGSDAGFNAAEFAKKIPKNPIHWHPHVTMLIKGQPVTIPPNVGLGAAEMLVHTHEANNVLHWEVSRPTVENMQLGYFFNNVWRKRFDKDCIFDNCNGVGGTLKMLVNGVENHEFDHYMPLDKDEIKIVFG